MAEKLEICIIFLINSKHGVGSFFGPITDPNYHCVIVAHFENMSFFIYISIYIKESGEKIADLIVWFNSWLIVWGDMMNRCNICGTQHYYFCGYAG